MKANKAGMILIATGCALPLATYVVADVACRLDAAKGGPPNQGAMIIAYLSMVASIGLGVLIAAIGAVVILWSKWQRSNHRTESRQS